jgi:hypothetical protein
MLIEKIFQILFFEAGVSYPPWPNLTWTFLALAELVTVSAVSVSSVSYDPSVAGGG